LKPKELFRFTDDLLANCVKVTVLLRLSLQLWAWTPPIFSDFFELSQLLNDVFQWLHLAATIMLVTTLILFALELQSKPMESNAG
jgi:hypothetical protein